MRESERLRRLDVDRQCKDLCAGGGRKLEMAKSFCIFSALLTSDS